MSATYEAIYYPESGYGGFTGVDGTLAFYLRVNALLTPEARVLDFGCGRGSYGEDPVALRRQLRVLRGKCAYAAGADVGDDAARNPYLDEVRLFRPGEPVPYGDGAFDVLLADCVVEHLPDPAAFFAEARRLLKPGGHLCLRTSNVLSYFGLAALLVPDSRRESVLHRARPDRKDEDSFPTLYRCNTVFAIRRALRATGFDGVAFGHESEPCYLGFSRIAYQLGVWHQRFAPGFLRPAIFAFATRR
ncbi:MAG: class I SAM-dependent methyltransferase [Bryobacteraceae bacterium]|nr:class I SAM-dependent methyltransferase [Bryobacteraceae bacterium]